jgi:uncharacterized protein (DUF1015 family)
MAEIQPLRAVHYDTTAAGPLDRLTAPPYDVIDAALRRELVSRAPHNVVEIDLPVGDDPYRHAGELWESWQMQGVLRRDSEPALWALEQTYTAPGGDRHTRRGFFSRVRVTDYGPGLIRPHERTHPAAKQDRLELMRATRANLSPIFSLYRDPAAAAWASLAPALERAPWGEVTDDDGTVHRMWRVADAGVVDAVRSAMAERELLIADGHHRYESAVAEGTPILAVLVSTSDPGLMIFPTHRVFAEQPSARWDGPSSDAETALRRLEAIPGHHAAFVQYDGRASIVDAGPGRPLDVEVIDGLGHEGISYTPDAGEAVRRVDSGEAAVAYLMRPSRIEDVFAVARRGDVLPPKSTYFYPKLLSGLLFHPV